MARVIDLGNGYGRVEGYTSPYASLTFPLGRLHLGKLYVTGYLSKDEYIHELRKAGHTVQFAEWAAAVASVTTEEWKARVERARTI